MVATTRTGKTVIIRITIEDYRDDPASGSLEWAIEINGMLWASGDCVNAADGEKQARAELVAAGVELSPQHG